MRKAMSAPLPAARPRWRRPDPRWLRNSARAGAALVLVGLIGGGVWLWKSGTALHAYRASLTGAFQASADLGLRVGEITVEGRNETPAPALLAALDVKRGTPLLALDLGAARKRLEDLPWVQSASIERRWPQLLSVRIVERTPLALWQCNGTIKLIDLDGKVIAGADIHRFARLPMVVGEGADKQAPGFLDILAQQPTLAHRVDAAIWVANRRWNLHLVDGIDVRLPEEAPEQALLKLVDYEAKNRLFERDVVMIDMRLPDRLIVRLAPHAVQGAAKPGKNT
jgi:cell division protein FtsQ